MNIDILGEQNDESYRPGLLAVGAVMNVALLPEKLVSVQGKALNPAGFVVMIRRASLICVA